MSSNGLHGYVESYFERLRGTIDRIPLERIEREWVNQWGLAHTRAREELVWTLPTGLLALTERLDIERGRVRDIRDRGYGRRFVLLAIIAFLLNVFNAPSSQLMNKYLSDVHAFSNSGIALFRTITTGVPGLFGLVIGGRLAEARGRRPIAAIALAIVIGGPPATSIFFRKERLA